MTLKDTLSEGRELPAATPKEALLGKAFAITEFEPKGTKFGEGRLATIILEGEAAPRTMWGGALLDRQLDKLQERGELPARVRLVWSDIVEGAYEFVDADDPFNEITQTILGAPDGPKRSRR